MKELSPILLLFLQVYRNDITPDVKVPLRSAGAMMVRYSYNERNVLRSQFGKQQHWPC